MQALSRGDMHLQGWLSNSPDFLRALAVEDPTITNTELSLGEEETEKVLGAHWKALEDTFTIRVNHLNDVELTPAGLASKVASLFDPQGMAAPMIVKAKIQLRELNTQGFGHMDSITLYCPGPNQWSDPVQFLGGCCRGRPKTTKKE